MTNDELVAVLLRESTARKDAGRWPDAVASLYQAKALMLVSPMIYPADTWCKLPLYLQQAGQFAESMAEFEFLLDDLPRRARQDARLDDPNVLPVASKQRLYKSLLKNDAEVIQTKRDLAQKRETKRKPIT